MPPKDIATTFAERLARVLATKPHGYQRELAEKAGVAPAYLNNVLSGRRRCSEDVRRVMAKVLGYEYDDFLFGDIFGRGGAKSSHGKSSLIIHGHDSEPRQSRDIDELVREYERRLEELRELINKPIGGEK